MSVPDDAPDEVTMEVGDIARAGGRTDADQDITSLTTSPRATWGWALSLMLIVALGATLTVIVTSRSQPIVTSASLFGRQPVAAPGAPDHQVVHRWFNDIPPDMTVAGLAVTSSLVVAQLDSTPATSPPVPSVVQAWDRTDGHLVWARELGPTPDHAPDQAMGQVMGQVVVLVTGQDSTDVTTLTANPSAGFFSTSMTALDATDGSVIWSQSDERGGWFQIFEDRGQALWDWGNGTSPQAQVLELATGTTVVIDSDMAVVAGGWVRRDPDKDEGGETHWDVLDHDATIRGTTTSDIPPAVLPGTDTGPDDDLLITLHGTDLVATSSRDTVVWSTAIPGAQPITATNVDVAIMMLGPDRILVGAFRTSENEVGRLERFETSVVAANGGIEHLDSPVVGDLALRFGFTILTIDGELRLACVRTADERVEMSGDADPSCPNDLALVQLDGSEAVGIDDVTPRRNVVAPPPGFALTTQPGMITNEIDNVLRLRAWDDLQPVWEIDLPRAASSFIVTTTEDGVAIGQDGPEPGVTWLS